MRVTYGAGNAVERPIRDLFDRDEASVEEVLEYFADMFGYSEDRVEAHVDGATVQSGRVSDTCVVDIVPVANRKGDASK